MSSNVYLAKFCDSPDNFYIRLHIGTILMPSTICNSLDTAFQKSQTFLCKHIHLLQSAILELRVFLNLPKHFMSIQANYRYPPPPTSCIIFLYQFQSNALKKILAIYPRMFFYLNTIFVVKAFVLLLSATPTHTNLLLKNTDKTFSGQA